MDDDMYGKGPSNFGSCIMYWKYKCKFQRNTLNELRWELHPTHHPWVTILVWVYICITAEKKGLQDRLTSNHPNLARGRDCASQPCFNDARYGDCTRQECVGGLSSKVHGQAAVLAFRWCAVEAWQQLLGEGWDEWREVMQDLGLEPIMST